MPPATMNNSVLSLSNSTSVTQTLQSVRQRFSKLYKRKANLHHYLDNMEIGDFVDARERLDRVIEEYDAVHE
ncbi:Tubulin/FtsZ [Zopfochytrium polystomum]|nr:Tubulin/FtsZ [Zopfochytrium polystomum]